MQKLSFIIQESRNEIQLFNHPIAKFSSYYSFQHAMRSGLASGIFLTSLWHSRFLHRLDVYSIYLLGIIC